MLEIGLKTLCVPGKHSVSQLQLIFKMIVLCLARQLCFVQIFDAKPDDLISITWVYIVEEEI